MKPKYIENKNNKFSIGDTVEYISLLGKKKKAKIIDFEMVKEWISKLSNGELIHPDYLIKG